MDGDRVRVRRAVPGDEVLVRSVRLKALADSPGDFDSTLERERGWTTAKWREWISRGATFIAGAPDEPGGIVAGVWNWDDPREVFLISMWVHPRLRGTGAADDLVASVVSWADKEGANGIRLHVVEGNQRARRLYSRNGFRDTGKKVVRERDGVVEVEMHQVLNQRS